ncbi:septal ring lytic transglycosylase RlpA family protein [Billgrantia gudaonensis]|uniref:Endolytic peptidoglycan transglycosylase RlpA n=1 Tax=Billgrantia gudaonensis TaxID=376427 RepID=A0A1G8TDY9_9GAMM|nr:septal ring lytic transglycosylase RlpA family protein [Halomonas gudaonensis]SDJ39607.1 rare lipoprotein A [Halomonas gudaonensis]
MRIALIGLVLMSLLAGCAGRGGTQPAVDRDGAEPASNGGRYALSGDAYPEEPPDVSEIPDAVPRVEPPSAGGNRETYRVWGKTYHVLPDARGYAREGTASWYGEKFHGYATSNGEIYDMYKMSAAHRSLPLPSYVRVTSRDNGRSVIVRVNDRGPFHSDREIDLSYAAAARLGFLEQGTGRVTVEAIDPAEWLAENRPDEQKSREQAAPARDDGQAPVQTVATQPEAVRTSSATSADARETRQEGSSVEGRPLYLQVAALGSADNARQLKVQLEDELSHPVRVTSGAGVHRVQVGPLAHADQVAPARDELRRAGFSQSFIVKDAD